MKKTTRKPTAKTTPSHASKPAGPIPTRAQAADSADLEPTASDRMLPALAFGVLAALLFWGDMYLMRYGGDLMGKGGSFPAALYYPIQTYAALEQLHPPKGDNLIEEGRLAYQKYCQACHQPSGLGQPGMFPPLAGSDWVLVDGPNRLIRLVLDGMAGPITVNGQPYNNVMVPWRDTISDDREIAAVLSFIRNEWGNQASEVSVEKVTAIRQATQDRAGRPWSAQDLLNIPPAD